MTISLNSFCVSSCLLSSRDWRRAADNASLYDNQGKIILMAFFLSSLSRAINTLLNCRETLHGHAYLRSSVIVKPKILALSTTSKGLSLILIGSKYVPDLVNPIRNSLHLPWFSWNLLAGAN